MSLAAVILAAAFLALAAAAWCALHRLEAWLLGGTWPTEDDDGPRLLPIYYTARPAEPVMTDDEFVAEVDRLGLRRDLLETCRESDAGLRVPDAFIELPARRAGGAR